MWQGLFSFTNVLAMIGWAMLVGLPRRPVVYSLILYVCVAVLCLTYLVLFASVVGGAIDPHRVTGSIAPGFSSIEGVRAIFESDGGVVIGWTHYLAFDLFTGLWISRDADAKGFGRLVQVPFLAATFIAGPIGLFSWLVVRERAARRAAKR